LLLTLGGDVSEETRSDVLARLKADLDQAWRENVAARARFDSIMSEIPQSIPHPDGSLRIRQAGADMNLALQHYIDALRRYTDCVTHPLSPGSR